MTSTRLLTGPPRNTSLDQSVAASARPRRPYPCIPPSFLDFGISTTSCTLGCATKSETARNVAVILLYKYYVNYLSYYHKGIQ